MEYEALVFPVLITIMVGGLGYAFLEPILEGQSTASRRQQLVAGGTVRRKAVAEAGSRRKQISETLKEIEQRQKRQNRRSLEQRLVAADLSWTRKGYIIGCCCAAVCCALILLLMTGHLLIALAGLALGGHVAPNFFVNFRIKRRLNLFLEEFPNAIEAIVRGIKSGLPLSDCINLIASEAKEPLRSEFRSVVEAQSMGIAIPDAIFRIFERVPLVEMSFFAIVIQIQSKSGGNLAEVLQNLATVIRDRKRLRSKIDAVSAEAKASALIIGVLPIAVGFLSYLGAPDYIALLWTTKSGQIGLGASIGAMVLGSLIMRKMTHFEI
jgi:tight adherence protein B